MKHEEHEKLKAELYARAEAMQQTQMPHPVDECGEACGGTTMKGYMGLQGSKPWVELSIEEKIERTRDQVKGRENELRYTYERMGELQREVRSIRREMIDHRHDLNDRQKVMLPADRREELNDAKECCNAAAPDVDPAKLFF